MQNNHYNKKCHVEKFVCLEATKSTKPKFLKEKPCWNSIYFLWTYIEFKRVNTWFYSGCNQYIIKELEFKRGNNWLYDW